MSSVCAALPAARSSPFTLRLLPVSGTVLACLAFCAGVCARCGADPWAAGRFWLCLVLYLLLPGYLLARFLMPAGALRCLTTPICGSGVLLGSYLAAMVCRQPVLLHLGPPALALLLFFTRPVPAGRCARRLGQGWAALLTRHRALLLLWAGLCVFSALSFSAVNPHPAAAGAAVLDRDLLWNVGNAEAFCKAFPAQNIRFAGVRFSYHYLTELLTAALSLVSGASCYDLFAFFLPPVFLAGEIAALYWLGLILYKEDSKANCIPFVLFCFQCASLWKVFRTGDSIFGNTMLRHLTSNINAQATAVILFCAFLALFSHLAARRFAGSRLWVLSLLTFGLFALGKGPEAALALCACGAAVVLQLLFRKQPFRALLFPVLLGGLFALMYRVLYAAGANTSMQFSVFSLRDTLTYARLEPLADWLCTHLPVSGYVWLVLIGVADVFLFAPFQFCLWARGLPRALAHLPRLDAARLLLHAGAVGGFLAYHLFRHESSSQVYFALFALLCMSVLAADELPRLPEAKFPPLFTLACGLAGLATALCMVLVLSGKGLAVLARMPGDGTFSPAAVTACDEEAGQWLRENAPAGMVFATNRTSGSPDPENEDGISNVYTAFSGVQCYMEGWTYAMSNMGVPAAEVEHRRAVVADLFCPDTAPQTREALCKREGITCLVWSRRWPDAAPAGKTPVFENAEVAIYWM